MNKSQQVKFQSLYRKHVSALKRQGKAESTIDVYARAVRRVAEYWDCCPDKLTVEQLEAHFDALIGSHSWSTVKVDRSGLQFFYEHVLKRPWTWVNMVKPPQVRTLPDILSLREIERLINDARELRYQVFILTAFSMGLRLGEVLCLQVGDIDSARMKVHIRCGKGSKDRLVTLPQMTLDALRRYWKTHRHATLLFPTGRTREERANASVPMDRGGVQKSLKVIAQSCGLKKRVTPHTLRHCYGALLVEAGVNLRVIQHEMGHERPNTTALYTQLTQSTFEESASSLTACWRRSTCRGVRDMETSTLFSVAQICERYRDRFIHRYGSSTTQAEWSALNAMRGCHTEQYGTLDLTCESCGDVQRRYRSCGHRFCNQCQQHQTQSWTMRQTKKLLPVAYFLVTFTLPYELRALVKAHSNEVYPLLMSAAAEVLRRFGRHHQQLNAELGLTCVLHTHTRTLDYHPHVHIAIPGGGVNVGRKQWRTLSGKYLFNGRALGKVFRGAFLNALSNAGLSLPTTPTAWVAHCEHVGRGKHVFQYLARYLYRGVIANKNILADDGENITFRYQDAETKTWKTRTLKGEDFMSLLLQHVLPKGLRRTRDYGFLHGNAKKLLQLVQYVLRATLPFNTPREKARFVCPHCQQSMRVMSMTLPHLKSG